LSCRQALVLALDVSGSVDTQEYAQQTNGLAAALNTPAVRRLILDGSGQPIALAVFEWSSRNHQYVIQPWISIDDEDALNRAIARIQNHRKIRAGLKTALGTALLFAQDMLDDQAHCWTHTIDVSADGRSNVGLTPQGAYQAGFDRITVNALVIGNPQSASGQGQGIAPDALVAYFETDVIHGPDSFAMIADGYADYARAMQRKLERELQPMMIGNQQTRPTHTPG
ncbi:MAG: DUF1194 domain-containing protein, partial [Pseudomonadota bacterium]